MASGRTASSVATTSAAMSTSATLSRMRPVTIFDTSRSSSTIARCASAARSRACSARARIASSALGSRSRASHPTKLFKELVRDHRQVIDRVLILVPVACPLARRLHRERKAPEPGLEDVVVQPGLHGLHRDLLAAGLGDHDQGNLREPVADGADDLQAVHPSEPVVGEHDVEVLSRERALPVGGRANVDDLRIRVGRPDALVQQHAVRVVVLDQEHDHGSVRPRGRPARCPKHLASVIVVFHQEARAPSSVVALCGGLGSTSQRSRLPGATRRCVCPSLRGSARMRNAFPTPWLLPSEAEAGNAVVRSVALVGRGRRRPGCHSAPTGSTHAPARCGPSRPRTSEQSRASDRSCLRMLCRSCSRFLNSRPQESLISKLSGRCSFVARSAPFAPR